MTEVTSSFLLKFFAMDAFEIPTLTLAYTSPVYLLIANLFATKNEIVIFWYQ